MNAGIIKYIKSLIPNNVVDKKGKGKEKAVEESGNGNQPAGGGKNIEIQGGSAAAEEAEEGDGKGGEVVADGGEEEGNRKSHNRKAEDDKKYMPGFFINCYLVNLVENKLEETLLLRDSEFTTLAFYRNYLVPCYGPFFMRDKDRDILNEKISSNKEKYILENSGKPGDYQFYMLVGNQFYYVEFYFKSQQFYARPIFNSNYEDDDNYLNNLSKKFYDLYCKLFR